LLIPGRLNQLGPTEVPLFAGKFCNPSNFAGPVKFFSISRGGAIDMDTAESIVDGAREASESAQQVADNFQQAVDRSVRDQPLTTLALACVAGFVLGAIWKA
jgi:hypothetical protein